MGTAIHREAKLVRPAMGGGGVGRRILEEKEGGINFQIIQISAYVIFITIWA